MIILCIILVLLFLISFGLNVVLFFYSKSLISTYYHASEAVSEIIVRFDAYKNHIQTIHELETFYGDKKLKDIFEHTTELLEFLKRFDGLYSFSQPELADILLEEDDKKEENEKQ